MMRPGWLLLSVLLAQGVGAISGSAAGRRRVRGSAAARIAACPKNPAIRDPGGPVSAEHCDIFCNGTCPSSAGGRRLSRAGDLQTLFNTVAITPRLYIIIHGSILVLEYSSGVFPPYMIVSN